MTVWDSMALNAPATARELAQDGDNAHGSTTEPENATCQPAGGFGGLAGQPINTAKYAEMMKCASRAVTLDDAWAQRLSNLKPMATDEAIAHALRNDAGWMAWQEVQRLRAENANLLIMLIEAHSRIVAELEEERDTQASLVRCACAYDRPDDLCLGHKRIFDQIAARRMQAILSAIAAEKAEWPHAGALHDGARMACDNIAARVKKLMVAA